MTTRYNLVAAVLGLAVATAAVGDASAKTIVKTVVHKTATIQTAIIHKAAIAHAPHRAIVGKRLVTHVRLVRRTPVIVKVVRPIPATAVRLVKRPLLHKQVLAHRVTIRKTIIR